MRWLGPFGRFERRCSAPPRVVHVVPALFGARGVVGGAERYAFELARHMARRVPTRLLTFAEGPDREEQHDDLEVRVLGGARFVRGQRANPIAAGLPRALAWGDVIHCHQQHVVASTASALMARASGRRVVVSDLGGGGFDLSGYVSTDRLFHQHLHISNYSREVFGHTRLARAHVIWGGVDVERFTPASQPPVEPRALFVGRLLPHKGLDDLIEGVPPELPLDVVGPEHDPGYRARLVARAAGKRVRFIGPCDESHLVDAYRAATVIVLPSVYQPREGPASRVPELLGQTLLEGMACGLAGVCTRVASLPEVVEEGTTGLIVPPNDPARLGEALRRLVSRPEEARAMGSAGRRRVLQRFTWDRVVDRCLTLYEGQEPR